MKKMLWKDIFKSISKSKGRFFSIMGLMMIGSFALVGLKVTGPDMRATSTDYFNQLNVADITIIGTLGIDENDTKVIDQTDGVSAIEYGYLKDVVIKDTNTSIRIFSEGDTVSDYQLVSGALPTKNDEIALDEGYSNEYSIGDTIEFTESEDVSGETVLKTHSFTVVGFVYSGEILSSINLGVSTAGTGSLNGYAVVTKDTFDSDVYMLARMTFTNLENVDPYSTEYTNTLQSHKDDLAEKLQNQPNVRIETVKSEYQDKINEGQDEINSAKEELDDAANQLTTAKQQLADGSAEIEDAQSTLDTEVSSANEKIKDGEVQLADAKKTIASGEAELESAQTQLADGKATLADKWNQLESAKQQLALAKTSLEEANKQLESAAAQLASATEKIGVGYEQLNESQAKIADAEQQIADAEQTLAEKQATYDQNEQAYLATVAQLDQKKNDYNSGMATATAKQTELDTQKTQLEDTKVAYENSIQSLTDRISEIDNELLNPALTAAEITALQDEKATVVTNLTQTTNEYQTFLTTTYAQGLQDLADAQQTLDTKKSELAAAKQQIDATDQILSTTEQQLDTAKEQLTAGQAEIDAKKAELFSAKEQFEAAKKTLEDSEAALSQKQAEYETGLAQYNAGVETYNQGLNTYYAGLDEWTKGVQTLDIKSAEYQASVGKMAQAKAELAEKQSELQTAKNTLATSKEEGEQKIADAKATLAEKQKEYDEKNAEYQDKKVDAEKEIAENQEKLDTAQETVDNLSSPVYSLYSRREIPGGDGNKIYSSISKIIDALANVFPIFLYFVAALVTLTTMARFVDEERIKSGTLKALGYENKDIIKKFTFYGLTASLSGTILGVFLGHTLLPMIVYSAYKIGFTVPKIELHFYWGISLIAVVLALVSAVLPAYIVASKDLKEKPAQLLLPKPPAAGSKILLERIKPIWNHMSFTHKVTARNIFRYKQRMFMTIFGVAGAAALLFAGFSVQHSIGGINERQFGDLIHYDMIVAENNYVTADQEKEIQDLLNSSAVAENGTIYYEELTKVAGANNDTQEIKLIVPQNADDFSKYITLVNRKSGDALNLNTDGVIISERFASLLGAKVGDTITVKDSQNNDSSMKVGGITEMYMGHFIFTSKENYEEIFGTPYETNAFLVNLADGSLENTKNEAATFIELDGAKGVVQNTTITTQIDTIVTALDKIMKVLIVVAGLLAVVILYNLTNINVSERIRELSTIKVLGFYNKEVTMYIYRETILLTILGILAGFGIGELLHEYIMYVVPPDDVMFNPALSAISFLVPTIIIGTVTLVLAFVINDRLKKVDMLEALKSVD